MHSKIKNLKELITNKFNDLTHSIEFNSEVIQELKNSITELQNVNKTLQAKNDQPTRGNAEIKKEINELIEAVIELKQYSRRSNFEINNLPECENEDIQQVISQIDNVANTNISESLITAHRVPSFSKDKPKPMIVQVKSKSFCWVRDGKIFLRKDESSKIIRVKSSQDLNIPFN
nr:uncharacterized protein LOC122269939 [Parasteatoda tepidariorum]